MTDTSRSPLVSAHTPGLRAVAFLREAARCFRNRAIATGEDMDFWANETNAENCERIAVEYADMLAALQDGEVKEGYPIKTQRVLHLAVGALLSEGHKSLAAELEAVEQKQAEAIAKARGDSQ